MVEVSFWNIPGVMSSNTGAYGIHITASSLQNRVTLREELACRCDLFGLHCLKFLYLFNSFQDIFKYETLLIGIMLLATLIQSKIGQK